VIRQKTEELNSSYRAITANLAGHDLDRKGAAGVVPAVLVVDLVGLVECLAGKGALEEGSAHFKDVAGLEGGEEERRGASDKSEGQPRRGRSPRKPHPRRRCVSTYQGLGTLQALGGLVRGDRDHAIDKFLGGGRRHAMVKRLVRVDGGWARGL
jgi:hypothetical protein